MHSRQLTRIRRGAAATAALAAAAASLLFTGSAPAGAASPSARSSVSRYVALGDSYAAGEGLSPVVDTACGRTSGSYPTWTAQTVKPAVFKDATCSGATTRSLWNWEGTAAPQVNALSKDTDLVTVTLGGNDLGFTDVLTACVLAGLTTKEGSPCRDTEAAAVDAAFAKLSPRLSSMLTDIRKRSPQARVIVVGYPNLFPADGSVCGTSASLAKGDVTWLNQTTYRLNFMLELSARLQQAEFVSTTDLFQGHDMCEPAAERWINPLLPVNSGSAHPNTFGQRVMAREVLIRISN
ncbi:SGNH/GDSL hydrolase family protein [Streptomyces sp. NPDC060198]|uniref:SGNH/GDSL hydrolase family protein n=1 Tax=Streptomyces sp. NPDC060198 TaxID=3347070 RepID=UPI00364810C2